MIPRPDWFDSEVAKDHELGRHDREPFRSCPDCNNERLDRESQEAIRNAERLQRGE